VQFDEERHFENFWRKVNETKTREVVDDLLDMNALPEELNFIKKNHILFGQTNQNRRTSNGCHKKEILIRQEN
jgi:hypothetical protein